MKLFFALIISLLVHLIFLVGYLHQEEQVVTPIKQQSLESIDFDLGIVAAETTSVQEKKINSQAQQVSKAGSVSSQNQSTAQQPPPKNQTLTNNSDEEISEQESHKVPRPIIKDKVAKKLVETASKPKKLNKPVDKKQKLVKKAVSPIKNADSKPPAKKVVKNNNKTQVENDLPEQTSKTQQKQSLNRAHEALNEIKQKPLPTENADNQLNAEQSIEQISQTQEERASGGKASQTLSTNAQAASYLAGLQQKIANSANRVYPKKAKRRNQQGVIKVGFYLQKDGTIKGVEIITPCEFPALNKAAIKAVKRVQQYKPRPDGVKEYFIIPISFKIR